MTSEPAIIAARKAFYDVLYEEAEFRDALVGLAEARTPEDKAAAEVRLQRSYVACADRLRSALDLVVKNEAAVDNRPWFARAWHAGAMWKLSAAAVPIAMLAVNRHPAAIISALMAAVGLWLAGVAQDHASYVRRVQGQPADAPRLPSSGSG